MNPTGSFKDRGMTMAVSKVVEEGYRAVICASTGNTSASAAAYAAKAGIRAIVVIPEGKIAMGKLAQAVAYGAHVISIPGNFDVALDVVREAAARLPVALVNSVNPYRIEGQKTGAFEICDALGGPPAYHCIPVGNAGNITSYWKGYREYREAGVTDRLPVMCGFQAAGAAPLVLGHKVEAPETIATAIRIGNPARGDEALAAARDSGGFIDMVTDDEILAAYKLVAADRGRVLRAGQRGLDRRPAQGARRRPHRGRGRRRLRAHRPRPQGPRHGGAHRRGAGVHPRRPRRDRAGARRTGRGVSRDRAGARRRTGRGVTCALAGYPR